MGSVRAEMGGHPDDLSFVLHEVVGAILSFSIMLYFVILSCVFMCVCACQSNQ